MRRDVTPRSEIPHQATFSANLIMMDVATISAVRLELSFLKLSQSRTSKTAGAHADHLRKTTHTQK